MKDSIHKYPSLLSGKVVFIKKDVVNSFSSKFGGSEFLVEDYWDRVSGRSWKTNLSSIMCLIYAGRLLLYDLPDDDEVLYGKIDEEHFSIGYLVRMSEIQLERPQ